MMIKIIIEKYKFFFYYKIKFFFINMDKNIMTRGFKQEKNYENELVPAADKAIFSIQEDCNLPLLHYYNIRFLHIYIKKTQKFIDNYYLKVARYKTCCFNIVTLRRPNFKVDNLFTYPK